MSSIKHNVADVLWDGPGGEFEVIEFHLDEQLSRPFILKAQMKTDQETIDFKTMINATTKIVVKSGDQLEDKRTFTGIITRFTQNRTGHGNLSTASKKVFYYDVEVRPKLWLLGKEHRSRVFQKLTGKDIVAEVLDEHGVAHKWDIVGTPRPREYCLQYDESSADFVQRLLEDEGFFYFFDHDNDQMVIADHSAAHPDCKPAADVTYSEEPTAKFAFGQLEHAKTFEYGEQLSSGSFYVNDYNYETSTVDIHKDDDEGEKPAFPSLEFYEHGLNFKDASEAKPLAEIRKQEELSDAKTASGYATSRSLACGHAFTLKEHWNGALNIKWILSHTRIHVIQGKFRVDFTVFPSEVCFRPPRLTPKPKVFGVQTAIVTGPQGEKVYLDPMGRCKVQFHWDREGKKDERSSMWIRVSNGYAGKDYGIQWIPRIGHEVLISFIDGDPDRPVVTGRVYNDANPNPLGPAEKWQNIIKTIKDNHILFDDKDDAERVDIRAQKDMSTLVLNDKTVNVRHDVTENVKNDMSVTVEEGDYDETVDKGSYARVVEKDNRLKVRSGDFEEVVEKGSHKQKIKKDKQVEVSQGDYSLKVSTGSLGEDIKKDKTLKAGRDIVFDATNKYALKALSVGVEAGAKGFGVKCQGKAGIEALQSLDMKGLSASLQGQTSLTLNANTSITIKCGASTISISPAGVNVTSAGMVAVKGSVLQLN